MDKKTLKFSDFNELVNPKNSLVYIPLENKTPIYGFVPHSFKGIRQLSVENEKLEIGLLIPKGLVVLNIDHVEDAKMIMKIIRARKEKVMAVKTPNGLHIYAISGIQNTTQNNMLALGVPSSTLCEGIGKTYVVTPFKSPNNTNGRLKDMEIIYYNGIGTLPFWLTPLHTSDSKTERARAFEIPIQDSVRLSAFVNQLTLMKFSKLTAHERADTMRIINKYMTKTPMTDEELEDEVISEHNGDQLPESVFFDKDKRFLHWKLGDYLIDYTNAVKDRATKQMFFYDERNKVYSEDQDFLKGVITTMVPSLTDNRKNEVMKHMASKLSLNPVALDNDPYLINFKNCVLDVESMQVYPHSPSFYGTIRLNVNYNPESTDSQVADEFFNTATLGDPEVEQLLYEALGYSMLKTIGLDKTFILTGTGRNGKSTFLNLIRELLGIENTSSIDFKELNSSFGTSGLAGKLASVAGDISNRMIDDSDIFKKVVSGDLIRINEKYKAKYEIVPFTTMFFSANDIPKTRDTTYAFYRRLCIVPFNADLTKISAVKGKTFQSSLLSESSKEYIAAKAVKAIHNVLINTQQFIEPKVVKKQLEEYMTSNSSTLQWIRDTDLNKNKLLRNDIFDEYSRYKTWCDINGRKPKGFNNFIEDIQKKFNTKYDHKSNSFDISLTKLES